MKSPNNFEFIKSISSATARTLSINNNITVAFYNDTEVVETKNQNEMSPFCVGAGSIWVYVWVGVGVGRVSA